MKLIFSLLAFFTSVLTFSQNISNLVLIESGMPLNNIGMIGKAVPNGEIKGNHYLFSDWVVADVLINEQKLLKDIEINVDLLRNEVDVLIGGNRKVLPKSIVSNFKTSTGDLMYYWQEIDGNEFIVAELVEGNSCDLLEQISLTIKYPTYNVALDMGSRDTQILRKTVFWIRNGDGSFDKIGKSNKKNLHIFDNSNSLKIFMKENQLSWNTRDDLIRIVQEANL